MLDQNRNVDAAYGYSAYGGSNLSLTKTAAGFSPNTNAYQFQSERFDTGSKTIDFGARHYSPSMERFVQRDSYQSALDDLGLSTDPLNGNRYVLTGANPINFVDLDGHKGSVPCAPTYSKACMQRNYGSGSGGGSGHSGNAVSAAATAAGACVISVRCVPAAVDSVAGLAGIFILGLDVGMAVGRGGSKAPQHTESQGPTATTPAPTPRAPTHTGQSSSAKPNPPTVLKNPAKAAPASVVVVASKKDTAKKVGAIGGSVIAGIAGNPALPNKIQDLLKPPSDVAHAVGEDMAKRAKESAPQNRADRREQQKNSKKK